MININTAAWLNQSVSRECGQQETLSVCELALDDSLLSVSYTHLTLPTNREV